MTHDEIAKLSYTLAAQIVSAQTVPGQRSQEALAAMVIVIASRISDNITQNQQILKAEAKK